MAAARRVPVLEAIADDPKVAPGDRIRAVDTLAKYGLGQMVQVGIDDVRRRLPATLELLRETLPEVSSPVSRLGCRARFGCPKCFDWRQNIVRIRWAPDRASVSWI